MKVFFLSLCVSGLALAAEPNAPRSSGKVLILENERTLTGDIERVGPQYRIRRTIGETWVPAERAIALCANVEEAFQVLRGRSNLRDPDERLRLAQWCRLNHLPEQALAEVEAAAKLRPEHRETRRLLRHLQQAALTRPSAPAHPPRELPDLGPPPNIDLTEEALGQFASRVQPILMNTCAGCHATGKGGNFRLTRAYDTSALNRRALQHNLAAVLNQINPAQPLASPLLTKSVSVHGEMTQAPLKSRQVAPYRTLEQWVLRTLENNPQLQREPAPLPTASTGPAPEVRVVPTTTVQPMGPNRLPPMPAAAPPAEPKKDPVPPDPFDPDEFNRQTAPGGNGR